MTDTIPPIYQLKRRAKLLARDQSIQHAEALDTVARQHGFSTWSLLAAQAPTSTLLSRLAQGDLLLLGARPGHGKTRLGLQLLLEAARDQRRAVLFTLEYTEQQAREHLLSLETTGRHAAAVEVCTDDEIDAGYITRHLLGSEPGSVAVVDYLQLLDQRRSKPPLAEQLAELKAFARDTSVILVFIAQIDRSFHPQEAPVPGIGDIRLPNAADLSLFSKACFLHNGAMRFEVLN